MLPLGGCLLSGEKPDPGLDIPLTYDGGPKNPAVAEAAVPTLDWWRGFHSKELTEVIEEARAANLDIAAAVARIVQADAQARVTGAALLPGVGLNGSATHSRSSQTHRLAARRGSRGGSEHDLLSTSLSASYEIDFWGKNRSALRAAEETAVASRYDREVVGLTTVVATANAYFQVLAAQDRLRVARENLASATRVLNLIQQRLNAGTASALDTAQQESLVDTQRASIPPLEQTLEAEPQRARRADRAFARARAHPRRIAAQHRHSARYAGPAVGIAGATPRHPPSGSQSRRRQRQCRQRARAVPAQHHAHRRGRLSERDIRTLLRPESAFYTAAAGLTQPIFEGGKLLGNLDLQKGRQDELLQTYRKAVISAFADVENALDAIRQTALRRAPAARRGDEFAARLRYFRAAPAPRAPSIWSPCCRRSRPSIRPRMRWRRRGSRMCRRSSVFIRRSAAAGCRSRWRPPMHGEMPKKISERRRKSRTRRNLAIVLILIAGRARRLVYVFTKLDAAADAAAVSAPKAGRCRCWSRPRPRPTCRSISTPSAPSRRSTP